MITLHQTAFFSLFTLGCNNEPEYDLSQIPVAEPEAPQDRAVAPDEGGGSVKGVLEIPDNDCAPPENQGKPITESNSVTVTVSLDSKVIGHQIMVDIIESQHGELLFGVVCQGTEFSFKAPKMLGEVRVAIFVDADENGPSKTDVQGITDLFTITNEAISLPKVEWVDTPLAYYHFDDKDRQPADPIPDMPAGEEGEAE